MLFLAEIAWRFNYSFLLILYKYWVVSQFFYDLLLVLFVSLDEVT